MGKRWGLVGCCAAAASLAAAAVAQAGAFAIRTQSAYGQGLSFAGIAAGGSLSSIFWNPANLAAVRGLQLELVGTGVLPDIHVKLDPVPALGFSGCFLPTSRAAWVARRSGPAPTGAEAACSIHKSGVTAPYLAIRSISGPNLPALLSCSSI